MKRKILLITHPVDFGNAAIGRNFIATMGLGGDLEYVSFSPQDLTAKDGERRHFPTALRRIVSGYRLADAFARARRDSRTVVIQGLSAALFTRPFRHGLKTFLILDWTRKLYEPILGYSLSSQFVTWLHRRTLLSAAGLLCLTDAIRQNLRVDYGICDELLHRIPAPFQVSNYRVSGAVGSPMRLLFVGGDFHRKGGDILLNWYTSRPRPDLTLTMVTQTNISPPTGVFLLKNDAAAGFTDYADFDILTLPTRLDSYPQVIGEAASAGLAIATTANALGAPDIVAQGQNGFIARSTAEFSRLLDELTASPAVVSQYKLHSRRKMLADSTPQACWKAIERSIFPE